MCGRTFRRPSTAFKSSVSDYAGAQRLPDIMPPFEPDVFSLVINCDGACPGNGQNPSTAAFGVYVAGGECTRFNKKGRIPAELKPTNNSAELFAIHEALESALLAFGYAGLTRLVIATDSQYAINCVTTWCKTWNDNGWKTSSGEDVVNAELIKDIHSMIEKLEEDKTLVYFWKVSREDNAEADALANAALREDDKPAVWTKRYNMSDEEKYRLEMEMWGITV